MGIKWKLLNERGRPGQMQQEHFFSSVSAAGGQMARGPPASQYGQVCTSFPAAPFPGHLLATCRCVCVCVCVCLYLFGETFAAEKPDGKSFLRRWSKFFK